MKYFGITAIVLTVTSIGLLLFVCNGGDIHSSGLTMRATTAPIFRTNSALTLGMKSGVAACKAAHGEIVTVKCASEKPRINSTGVEGSFVVNAAGDWG